jgi:carotenoid cleavage dioxygenase-like enzyme
MLNYQEPNHAPVIEGMYKYDLLSKSWTSEMFRHDDDDHVVCGGEPYFVPKISCRAEDDGYLVVLVNDFRKRRTELRVHDAVMFGQDTTSLVATIVCPKRIIPLGTHGLWIGKDEVVL